jgi:hypothetical protein
LLTKLIGEPADAPWVEEREGPMPAETFADAYAACALGLTPQGHRVHGLRVGDWQTAYGYHPTTRQHRRVCFTIQFLGWYRAYQSAAS